MRNRRLSINKTRTCEHNFNEIVLCNIPFLLTLTGHCLYDLPSDILEHIFQFFKMQDCLNIVAHVCRRFYKIVNDFGALGDR